MPKNHDGRELCHFTYADGRRCTLPQFPDDMGLCYHHGDQYRASLQSKEAGRQVSEFLSADILTACDLSRTLSALFSATAQGYLQPKVASSLGYIAQLMLQTQKLAKQEYLEAFDDPWPKVVADGAAFNDPEPEPDEPQSEPQSLSDPAATLPTRDQLSSPILVPDASPCFRYRRGRFPNYRHGRFLSRCAPGPFSPSGILCCRWPTSAIRVRPPFHLDPCGAQKEAPL